MNLLEKLRVIFISVCDKYKIRSNMATTIIDTDNNKSQDNTSMNNNKKTMLERMKEVEARYPKLFEALAKEDRSLIRK